MFYDLDDTKLSQTENEYSQLWESNRDKSHKPKKVSAWCFNCDSYLVRPGQKCPRCGTRMGKPRIKKDTNA